MTKRKKKKAVVFLPLEFHENRLHHNHPLSFVDNDNDDEQRHHSRSYSMLMLLITHQSLCAGCCFIFGWACGSFGKKIVARAKQTSIAYLILTWKGRYSLKLYAYNIYICVIVCVCVCTGTYGVRINERQRKSHKRQEQRREPTIKTREEIKTERKTLYIYTLTELIVLLFGVRRPQCDFDYIHINEYTMHEGNSHIE